MTIDELISKKYIVRSNSSGNIIENIDKIIKSVLLDAGINMKIIETDYVFPRILQTSNGEKVLIWDQTYWKLYGSFLSYFSDLNTIQKGSNVLVHTGSPYSDQLKILIPFSYYLALIVENQSIAINFAKYYNQRSKEPQIIRLGMSLRDFFEYIEIAKMYIAVHEQMHFTYKNDNKKRENDISGMKQLLDIAYKLVENFDGNFCEEEYLKSKSELLEMVSTAYSDMRIQEELLCDTYALNNCLFVYRKCWGHRLTQKDIVTKCFEAIRIIGYYNSVLISLRMFWKDCSCNINRINEFQKSTIQRSYLSEIIATIQLARQKLHDYDGRSLWKFDGFEYNYFLENIIYCYFFDKDSIDFWKNLRTETEENERDNTDKFGLLHWRIN